MAGTPFGSIKWGDGNLTLIESEDGGDHVLKLENRLTLKSVDSFGIAQKILEEHWDHSANKAIPFDCSHPIPGSARILKKSGALEVYCYTGRPGNQAPNWHILHHDATQFVNSTLGGTEKIFDLSGRTFFCEQCAKEVAVSGHFCDNGYV